MAMAFFTDENARIKRHAIKHLSSNCVVPHHYNLKITPRPGYVFTGEFNGTIYINCAIEIITLHIDKDI